MIEATSCGGVVIFRGKILVLYKNYKNKYEGWVLPKGTVEAGEEYKETALREVKEETGYTLTSYRFCGIVTFVSGNGVTEYMSLFTADAFTGEPIACNEGELVWVNKEDVVTLNIWEGDKIFFWLMQHDAPFFSLRLEYVGDELVSYSLNGIYHRQKAEGQSMYQEFLDTYRS